LSISALEIQFFENPNKPTVLSRTNQLMDGTWLSEQLHRRG